MIIFIFLLLSLYKNVRYNELFLANAQRGFMAAAWVRFKRCAQERPVCIHLFNFLWGAIMSKCHVTHNFSSLKRESHESARPVYRRFLGAMLCVYAEEGLFISLQNGTVWARVFPRDHCPQKYSRTQDGAGEKVFLVCFSTQQCLHFYRVIC